MCLTLQMRTLEKYLTKILKFFLRGYPFLAPRSAASPKMTTPVLPMTPLFYQKFSYIKWLCSSNYSFVLVISYFFWVGGWVGDKAILFCKFLKSLVCPIYSYIIFGLNFVVLVLVLVKDSNMSIIKTFGIGLEMFPISRLLLALDEIKNWIDVSVLDFTKKGGY